MRMASPHGVEAAHTRRMAWAELAEQTCESRSSTGLMSPACRAATGLVLKLVAAISKRLAASRAEDAQGGRWPNVPLCDVKIFGFACGLLSWLRLRADADDGFSRVEQGRGSSHAKKPLPIMLRVEFRGRGPWAGAYVPAGKLVVQPQTRSFQCGSHKSSGTIAGCPHGSGVHCILTSENA